MSGNFVTLHIENLFLKIKLIENIKLNVYNAAMDLYLFVRFKRKKILLNYNFRYNH